MSRSAGRAARGAVSLAAVAGVIAGTAYAAQPAGAVAAAQTAHRPAVSAAAFINSVGVNVHTYYNDTSYADNARTLRLLRTLGVRHVRDGLVPNRPDQVAALTQLGKAGIRSALLVGGTARAGSQRVDPDQLAALDQVDTYTDAVEPSNEYDCSGDSNWAANQRAYAATLDRTVRADADLNHVGVLGSSFCRPDSVAQFGSVAGQASLANAHNYPAGQAPELALEGRTPAWSQAQQSSLPLVVTETGYHNALNAGAWSPGVTEATAADYTVRALLDAKRIGISRTYLYELLDQKPEPGLQDPEQHYGLVRQNGSVKPAYTAVRRLLADLARGNPNAVKTGPTTSDITSIRGGGSLLRTLSIADPKGGGETLALWLATPLENTTTHARLANPARNVTVRVNGAHSATTKQPSRSDARTALGAGRQFTVPVSGAVTLLHLAPAKTAPARRACTALPGYAQLSRSLGAIVTDGLGSAGFSGSPAAATRLPDGVAGGTHVTSDGQRRTVNVPRAPTAWTISLWERTDSAAQNFAAFAHAAGVAGGVLRTYDMSGDSPSHMQLSAYGTPQDGAGFGNETFGQALSGGWHLVALSVGGGKATLTVDGVVQGSVASGGQPLTAVELGSLTSGFRGSLAGLSVFGRALSANDLARLATTSAGTCSARTPRV